MRALLAIVFLVAQTTGATHAVQVAAITVSDVERPYEISGSPSDTGCDGWFNGASRRAEGGGTFSGFTLQNRSTSPECLATRATLLFHYGVQEQDIRLRTPPGWTRELVRCNDAPDVCGVRWSGTPGVGAGELQRGFSIQHQQKRAFFRIWIVDVGPRRVAVPIGTIGPGLSGRPAERTVQTATLTGKVVNRSGAPIPGATVTVESSGGMVSGRAEVRGDGTFRIADLRPGTYTVRFELAGFLPYVRQRLTLTEGQEHNLTVGLDIGPLERPLVDKEAASNTPIFTLADGEVAIGIETSVGTFYIAVDTKRAPITANNFLKYVDAGLYDEGRFHRATRPDNYTPSPPNRPMMNLIQGGINQARRSQGFPPVPLERTSVTGIKHVTGVVSMARGTGADTATSDFFVLLDDQPSLDFGGLRFDDGQGGAAFGHVLSGVDVVRKIQQQPVDGQNLAAPVTIRKVWRVK